MKVRHRFSLDVSVKDEIILDNTFFFFFFFPPTTHHDNEYEQNAGFTFNATPPKICQNV